MKKRAIQCIPVVLALLAIGFSYFSQWCTADGQICYRTVLDQMFPYITNPLYFFALYVLPLTVILVVVPRTVYDSWLKFSLWAVPISFIFIWSQPVYGLWIYSSDRAGAAQFSAVVLSIVSLVIVIWKYFSFRRSKSMKI